VDIEPLKGPIETGIASFKGHVGRRLRSRLWEYKELGWGGSGNAREKKALEGGKKLAKQGNRSEDLLWPQDLDHHREGLRKKTPTSEPRE